MSNSLRLFFVQITTVNLPKPQLMDSAIFRLKTGFLAVYFFSQGPRFGKVFLDQVHVGMAH